MFALKIKTENAAFENDHQGEGLELARILRRLADKVENIGGSDDHGVLMDVNGNRVGEWEYEKAI